jgi:hypothetical protein
MLINLRAVTAAHQRRDVPRSSGRDRFHKLFVTGTIHCEYKHPRSWYRGLQLGTKLCLATPDEYLSRRAARRDEKNGGGREQD